MDDEFCIWLNYYLTLYKYFHGSENMADGHAVSRCKAGSLRNIDGFGEIVFSIKDA